MTKIKNKYLIFKTSIVEMKIYLLVDNENETKLINKFFVHVNKVSSFKLKKSINFTLENSKIVQKLIKSFLINVIIGDHIEQVVYYLAKLDMYIVILDEG